MTLSTWQTIKFECFLGFGMWSVPPYCETKDLMNRIRKIHFKRHNSNIEDEEFDNYMTIWKVPCYFFLAWNTIFMLWAWEKQGISRYQIWYIQDTSIFLICIQKFRINLILFFLRLLLGYALLQQWICLKAHN